MSERSDDEQKRREILDACNDEIVALLHEAEDAGLPLEKAVVVVADDHDPLGLAVVQACSRLGDVLDGAEVFVMGLPYELACEVLASVDVDLPERLHPSPPPGAAQVLCIAAGGVLSMFLGLEGHTPGEPPAG